MCGPPGSARQICNTGFSQASRAARISGGGEIDVHSAHSTERTRRVVGVTPHSAGHSLLLLRAASGQTAKSDNFVSMFAWDRKPDTKASPARLISTRTNR